MEGPHVEEGLVGPRGNHCKALSLGQRRLERERRSEQDRMQDGNQTRLDSDEGSSQGERTIFYAPEQLYRNERDHWLENLRKKVKELEIEIRGWHCRRDREGSPDDPNYTGVARLDHLTGVVYIGQGIDPRKL
nr:hypothetical protein CFP56_48261 [Quercus suber]